MILDLSLATGEDLDSLAELVGVKRATYQGPMLGDLVSPEDTSEDTFWRRRVRGVVSVAFAPRLLHVDMAPDRVLDFIAAQRDELERAGFQVEGIVAQALGEYATAWNWWRPRC